MFTVRVAFLILCPLLIGFGVQSPDLSTPEAAVRSFLSMCRAGDLEKAVSCIENAKYDPALDAIAQNLRKHPPSFTIGAIHTQIDGDRATIKMSGTLTDPVNTPLKFSNVVKLHKGAAGWQIVPDRAAAQHNDQQDPVNSIAVALSDPHVLMSALDSAKAVACLSNLKQLALGVLMLIQDHNEKYAFKADGYKAAIGAYIKNEQVFHCPLEPPGAVSYSFNPHIAGQTLAKITMPSNTVMLYEGKDGKLNFRHGGKAGVAFADGHARMITQEEAKKLRWDP